jgi:hypothetical protein
VALYKVKMMPKRSQSTVIVKDMDMDKLEVEQKRMKKDYSVRIDNLSDIEDLTKAIQESPTFKESEDRLVGAQNAASNGRK